MKCISCNCPVPTDFKYSFTINQCPKCGKSIMKDDVKDLFFKIDNFLTNNNNDYGDLTVWLINEYIPNVVDKFQSEPTSDTSAEPTDTNIDINESEVKPEVVNRSMQEPTKKIDTSRANLFAKRAGVDKIKYETIVKDIQGKNESNDLDISNIESEDVDFSDNVGIDDEKPLSSNEMKHISSLFENKDSGSIDFNELQKLQKAEQLSMTGAVGKIRRSS